MANKVAFALAEAFEVDGILMVPQVRFLGLLNPVHSYAIPGAHCEIGGHWGEQLV